MKDSPPDEPRPDSDIDEADSLLNFNSPGEEGAAAYATQAQAYALISIAKTLRRLETILRKR